MTPSIEARLGMRILFVDDELAASSATGRAVRAICADLAGRGVDVVEALAPADARAIVNSDSSIQCVI
ncbi:hypothetical protein ABTL91_19840, partial [Acinetobacter baumannii]